MCIRDRYSIEYIRKLSSKEISKIITPMDKALYHLEEFIVSEHLYSKLINGVVLRFDFMDESKVDKLLRVYCKDIFIGIGKISNVDSKFYLKMDKVLII